MSRFRFYLNGQLLKDQPDGWHDFTESIVRDEELHGMTLEYEQELTFGGDGYKILESQFLESFCSESNLVVQQKCGGNYETVTELLIKLTDLDTNLSRCITTAKATDSGYYGIVHNNREVEVPLNATLSKNGVTIDPCPELTFSVFLPNLDGTDKIDYLPETRTGHDHREVLAFIMRYITDNRINQIQSSYLDSLAYDVIDTYFDTDDQEQPMTFAVISGYNLRAATTDAFTVTFQGMINTLFTKHGLFWRVNGDTLFIEPVADFFPQEYNENLPKLNNQRELIRSMDTSKLYAAVQFGSEKDIKDRDLQWSMPFVDLISHQKQRYNLSGVCNTDVVLNLVDGFVYDSNVIEKVIVTQEAVVTPDDIDTDFDNDIFYIQVFQHVNGESADDLYYSCFNTYFLRPDAPNPDKGVVYNPYLFNIEVSKRHTVQADYSLYVVDSDDNFQAEQESDNYYNGDFQDETFLFTTGVSGVLQNIMQAVTGWIGVPQVFTWGGLVNNADTSCYTFDGTCASNPLRLPFSNDSTGGNFDPNDNWDVIDYKFTAPSTGVYGFDLNLLINKTQDLLRFTPSDGLVPTTNLATIQNDFYLIRARSVAVNVYMVRYDSLDNMIGFELIYGSNPVTGEQNVGTSYLEWTWGNGMNVITGSPNNGNNSAEVSNTLLNTAGDFPSQCTMSFPENKSVQRSAITYLESGQRVGFVAWITTGSHFRAPFYSVQRYVRYNVLSGSTIKTNYVVSGGGEFQAVDPRVHFANEYNFNRPTTIDFWRKLKGNPIQPIGISPTEDKIIKSYTGKISRNLATGATEFQTIGNRNQINF